MDWVGAPYWKAMFVLILFSVWNGLAFKIMVSYQRLKVLINNIINRLQLMLLLNSNNLEELLSH